jgi:hypothetical protein
MLSTNFKNFNATFITTVNCTGSEDLKYEDMPIYKFSDYTFSTDAEQKAINRKSSTM